MISSFLWRIFSWIRYRALWVTLGIIVLFLLIWYAGPLFAFGDFRPLETVKARLWLIGLICIYFLLRYLLKRWYASRMNERVADVLRSALSPSHTSDENEERIGILRGRFTEALDVLRKVRFEKTAPSLWNKIWQKGRYVYELPWYVIIGAPGVGKTTALLNSGLSFPLAKQIGATAIRGAGGTRHCDWWFTNEAVFIDTAGRYTTHETDAEKDKIEWRGFLSLLKKNRSRQPINGVLLMLSVSDLLSFNSDERQAYATTLRRRLDELYGDLEMAFPVYLLLNKCDLLLGFNEYFAALDRSGREQVWGFTLPFPPSGKFELSQEELSQEFNIVEKRINAGLVDVLQAEPDLRRRELIYTFPQQLSILSLILQETVKELFTASRFSKSPLLRGIYLTSATQEGTPFDRIVNVLGQDFPTQSPEIKATTGEGKAFFIQELLSKVVFAEAHLAGTNRRAERRSRAYHIAAYSLCAGLLVGSVLAWIDSYRNNLTYITEVDTKTNICEAELPNFPKKNDSLNINILLPFLDIADELPDSNYFKVDHPLMRWTFGLYQGKKLQAGSKPLYNYILLRYFVPAIKYNIEQWLRAVDIVDMELSYEILRAYIMMHESEHFDEEEFVNFVVAMWGDGYPEGTLIDERNALVRHLKAAISMNMIVPVTSMDMSLVQSTRARLSQYTSSQRIYHRLIRLLRNTQLPEFSVASEAGVQGAQVFVLKSGHPLSYGVPALYTYRGYHELFKIEVDRVLGLIKKDESWILGVAQNERAAAIDVTSGRLVLDIKRHYMLDYISYWEKYIEDITILEPTSLEDTARIVDLLSSVDSPLRRLLLGIARETTLLKDVAVSGSSDQYSLFERAKRTMDATTNDLKRIAPQGVVGSLGPKEIPELWVNNRFAAIREFVNGSSKDSSNSPMLQAVRKLEELRGLLMTAIDRKRNGLKMPEARLVTEMELSGEDMPEPFKRIFKTAATKSAGNIKSADQQRLTSIVREEVTSFCKKAIEGRYPVSRRSGDDIIPADFATVFGPSGSIERFRQEQGEGAKFSPDFDRARVIRDVFFRNGNLPQITFTIRPLIMDATITVLRLNIGNQTIRYDHGPRIPTSVTWPGSDSQNVTLELIPAVENGTNSVSESGLWALHRLFDKFATIQPGATTDVFNIELTVGGRKAMFEVKSSGIHNPFRLPELENFSCPREML
ncbi:MAG: type VI secretion system membrane subunit TssM [Oscillospiraceae bacterium]|nr:type VI secretion system membrane subunit TssM [Oscillospiraceae bacterium]